MKKRTDYWWSTDINDIEFCFACGNEVAWQRLPHDKHKRLVCGTCGHITYLNPKSVAGVIPVMPDGRIALLQREIDPARGKWSYPAGYQELGETVRSAAVRESWEEISVRPKLGPLLNVYSYENSGVITTVFIGYLGRQQHPKPGVESQSVRLFEPKKIPWKQLAFLSTVDALRDYMDTL